MRKIVPVFYFVKSVQMEYVLNAKSVNMHLEDPAPKVEVCSVMKPMVNILLSVKLQITNALNMQMFNQIR